MKIESVEAQTITGVQVRTMNADETNPETAKLSGLWEKFYRETYGTKVSGGPVFGVYSDYESDETGAYTVLAGVAQAGGTTTEGLSSITIPAGEYLVFEGKGKMPGAVIETWGRVWAYFSDSGRDHNRAFTTDFELYKGPDEIAIYIAVE